MANPAPIEQSQSEGPELTERIFIAVNPVMLKDVEDFRFSNRFKSQSGAVRRLIELGLRAAAWEAKKSK